MAANRIKHLQLLLDTIGVNPNRVQMFNVSAAMAAEFIKHTKTMTDQLKEIGHNPLKSNS